MWFWIANCSTAEPLPTIIITIIVIAPGCHWRVVTATGERCS